MSMRVIAVVGCLLVAACGGASVFPEVFSQERADGKIPVKVEFIREQTQKEIDGMPEKQATVERWREIETDYNACRVSSARKTKAEAKKVFADCMSGKGYVYMLRLDAEQLHNDIAAKMVGEHRAAERAEEEERRATEKKAEEERVAAEHKQWNDYIINATKKAQENKNASLHTSTLEGDAAAVREWLDAGASPNTLNRHGDSVLMFAANKGYLKVAVVLLEAGANPNLAREGGDTALMFAAKSNYPKIAQLLIAYGAYPDLADNEGYTPLIIASSEGNPEVVKTLLNNGAKPNAVDNEGATALMQSAFIGDIESAKILLSAGANPNHANDYNNTALIFAAWKEQPDVAKVLLDCGANPNIKNIHDADAWYWAKHHPIVLPIFEQYKVKVESGWRPQSCKGKQWSQDIQPISPKFEGDPNFPFDELW